MTSTTKGLLILAILLLLALALSVASTLASVGRRRCDESGLPGSERLEELRRRWFSPAAVSARDLEQCSPGALADSCWGPARLGIAAAKSGPRELRVAALQPLHLRFAPHPGPADLPLEVDLAPGDTAKFPVPEQGAALEVQCVGAARCLLAIRSREPDAGAP